jgi:predicted dehydrogenase
VTAPVRIGFIGGGMIAQIAHIPFYAADARCRIVAIAEPRPTLVDPLRALAPEARILASHRELLVSDDVDAVVLVAPRPATGPLTLDVLSAGKHVLAEKPMAHTVDQARRLVDAAAVRGLVYAVGFMKRYDPGVEAGRQAFREALESGRLGRLQYARFYDHSKSYAVPPPSHRRPSESRAERFATWPIAPDWLPPAMRDAYAWYMNAASHDVNLMHYFFADPPELASAAGKGSEAVVATFRSGDVPVALDVTRSAAGLWIEGADFLFEAGRIALRIPSPMAVDRETEVVVDDGAAGRVGQRLPTERGWSFARQATGFVDALTGGSPPATSGTEGLADIATIETVWKRIAGIA